MPEVVANQVSLRDLKTHLSECLSRVQAGEVVEVTSHRKPIGSITGVKKKDPASTNPLQMAIDAGIVSWNGQKPIFASPVKLNDGGPLISDIVIEARDCDPFLGYFHCLFRATPQPGGPAPSAGGAPVTAAPTITSELDHLDQLGAKAFDGYLISKGLVRQYSCQ